MKKIIKSSEEWKKNLTDAEYSVTREKGTEAPFSGELYNNTQGEINQAIDDYQNGVLTV